MKVGRRRSTGMICSRPHATRSPLSTFVPRPRRTTGVMRSLTFRKSSTAATTVLSGTCSCCLCRSTRLCRMTALEKRSIRSATKTATRSEMDTRTALTRRLRLPKMRNGGRSRFETEGRNCFHLWKNVGMCVSGTTQTRSDCCFCRPNPETTLIAEANE